MEQPKVFKFRSLIYPAHKKCTVHMEPIFPVKVDPADKYEVRIYAFSGIRMYGLRNTPNPPTEEDDAFFSHQTVHPLTVKEGALELELAFPQEDCYRFRLYINDELTEVLELYAVEEDLFGLTPFKGDCHIHTYMSDGRESPAYMAAAACKHGLDFCAITDHMAYEPSLIAGKFWQEVGVDFLVLPGEEVHSPNNRVHIINLGGSASVNDWWRDHEDEYYAAVEQQLAQMPEPMAVKQKFIAAASQVIFDRIHSVDGLAVMCHPHWAPNVTMNQPEDVTQYLCAHRRFDLLELVAGGATDGQQQQYNYFSGWDAPVMGNSDVHGCFLSPLEPRNYSLVFAKNLDWVSLKEAFLQGYTLGGDENHRLHGNYRLAKYGEFLERCFYPLHDKHREALGTWMLRWASGQPVEDTDGVLQRPTVTELFDTLRYKS